MNPELHLAALKHKLLHAKDFAEVMTYFFDHLGEDQEFMALGQGIEHERLETIIANVAASFFPQQKALVLGDIRFIRLPQHQFIHGGFFLAGCLANVIYFEDVQKGLVTIAGLDGEAKFARFSDKNLRPDIKPSRN